VKFYAVFLSGNKLYETVTSKKHRISTRVRPRDNARLWIINKIQPNNFTGSFKLAENKNYEKYQQELGVSWIKMKMGALLTPMEKIRLVFHREN
jgi:hypothetical protein